MWFAKAVSFVVRESWNRALLNETSLGKMSTWSSAFFPRKSRAAKHFGICATTNNPSGAVFKFGK